MVSSGSPVAPEAGQASGCSSPLTKLASGEARKATAAATSSGRPARPLGLARAAWRSSAVLEAVAIQPGATLFTVMPLFATSSARPMLQPTRPALAALYAASPGLLPRVPVVEATLTIRP